MRPITDPAWADAQYNNRARIADHAEIFSRWRQSSASARAKLAPRVDLRYGPGDGETLDVFGSGMPESPVLVFIHGGYWRSLDKADHSFVAPAFVSQGVTVVIPNYALAPAVSVEHVTLQVARALAWVWRNAADLAVNRERLVVVGHSAGGHAAAMLLSCRWPQLAPDLPPHLLRRAMAISGLYDLEPLRHAPFLQPDLKLTPASVERLSPAFFPRPRGQLYAVAGADETDEFLRQNRLIREVWGPTSVPVCETVPARNHLTVLNDLADPASRLTDLALRLLDLR